MTYSEFREVCHTVFGKFMIVFLVILAVLAGIGYWMKKREASGKRDIKTPDQALNNVADWADNFNRARYQDQDGK